MADTTQNWDRRTGVDVVANHLYEEITSLRLLPGTKISEADIAARFGVSRQPVRDAFSRLANLDLLLIRPQKATEVKRFSMRSIEKARFVRAAVDSEVLRRASRLCDDKGAKQLETSLDRQRALLTTRSDHRAFNALDYEFHKLLCEIAGVGYAFDIITEAKAKVDRLCVLGLSQEDRLPTLIDDHEKIAAMVIAGKAEEAVEIGMLHLSRLDSTIESIQQHNAAYFESDED
ncbi:GntR family transcriptional regulator [Puniceibacterium confluentis]|uniref:GntR family transcriptional regulator n=1 Tax=Puniceibacterium confluentis TaxID=1958944 RepID=UPI0011B6AC1A|nr:GntR family transcriptional regulator [Puniceibacterium confluentis]